MGFIALIFALLIEQGRPLAPGNLVARSMAAWVDFVAKNTDAGHAKHGVLGWFIAVWAMVGLTVAIQLLAAWIHPLALFCFYVLVLYLTMGFRQFSHAFTSIQVALAANDDEGARRELARWLEREGVALNVDRMPMNEVCRLSIAHALIAAHRHVFGPLFWFVLLPGATGPVLYRLAQLLAERWQKQHAQDSFGRFAQTAYRWIDWIPSRLSAAGFAVVGNFEDAVYCWRGALAASPQIEQRDMLLAAGGGALGIRLADPTVEAQWVSSEQSFDWQGAEPSPASMRSAVGLVWRSVVLWVFLFAMLTMANWLGR
jgi:cobalamin biosynthesis protein CobD/CbiB